MSQKKGVILVIGGAGYIGSHVVRVLLEAGYQVIILDNLIYGHRDLVETILKVELIIGDIGDLALLDHLFSSHSIEAVMHFAGFGYVGESIQHPQKYYRNNVANTLTLLEAMNQASVNKLVFSSTCATYGIAQTFPITEKHPQQPINTYGKSKLMVERMLKDFSQAYPLKYVCFRYFNAAGAHPDGLLGEDHNPESHLIPLVLLTALGKRESISIFGTDYPTPDGTCIRDYLHVMDIAQAHLLGLEYLLANETSNVFNLGNGNGFSIQQVIDTSMDITQRPISVNLVNRRPGDPPILVSSNEKARQILGWKPQYPNLEEILAHAWQWHQKRHQITDLT